MQRSKKIPIVDLNEYITCKICRGYFVDATTIIECLHTFCRSCIVKYLEKNKYCPICDVQVHKTKPLFNIRPDKIIQDLVYKLVPRLFQNEMHRRRGFYSSHPEAKPSNLEQCGEAAYQHLLTPEETICLTLSYHGSNNKPRYLRCPAAVSLSHLEKLIRAKFDLTENHKIEILYNQDCLNSSLTLMDIAYIYLWKRKGPIELTYRIYECVKKPKLEIAENAEIFNDNVNINNNSSNNNNNWKEVQLRISENGEMSITGIRDAGLDQSLLEIVNSEPKFKNEVDDELVVKKEASDAKYCGKENSTEPVKPTSFNQEIEEPKLPISTSSIPFNIDLISTQGPQIVDIPIQTSLTNCASLSSATTTTVYSTINNSKCSTKSEDSLFKFEAVEKVVVVKENDASEIDNSLKRKSDMSCDTEPPLKQSKPTILNNSVGLLNLSYNHPLKKHSKMNRNGENPKEPSNKVVILENEVIANAHVGVARSIAETSTSKQNVINKNANNVQVPKFETPVSLPKSILVTKQSIIPPKPPTTNYTACYMPKNVYNRVISIPKPVTSCSSVSITKNDSKPHIPASITVTTTIVSKSENKSGHVNSSPQQSQQQHNAAANNKFVIKSKPSTPIGYKTLRDPPKSWNSQISKANLSKSTPEQKYGDTKNVKPKFFKMRNNLPRYLGNPASGVKPMYQVHVSPEKEKQEDASNKVEKSEIRKHSIVKIDPKTLKPFSMKAPETTSLSSPSTNNLTSQSLNVSMNSPSLTCQTDLKINTSSVPIFNPLKLQSSPKNDRKSPKSPHSPKMKNSSSPTSGNKREKVNLTFTPPNPFVPRLASPTCPMGPGQFLYPSPYDPRVMAAYTSLWYGQRMAQAGFPGAAGFPGTSSPGLGLDLNQQQRKTFEMMAAAAATAAAVAQHETQLSSSKTSPVTTSSVSSKVKPVVLNRTPKQTSGKRSSKETKNEKSLENAVEKLTQNKSKSVNSNKIDKLVEDKKKVEEEKESSQDAVQEVFEIVPPKQQESDLKSEEDTVAQKKSESAEEETIVKENCVQDAESSSKPEEAQSEECPKNENSEILSTPQVSISPPIPSTEKIEKPQVEEVSQVISNDNNSTETNKEENSSCTDETNLPEENSKQEELSPSEKCDVVQETSLDKDSESGENDFKDKHLISEVETSGSSLVKSETVSNLSEDKKDSELVQKGE